MTGEEVERAIEFLRNHQARVSSDIKALIETQKITAAYIASLTKQPAANPREMREPLLPREMRDRLERLILSNEATRGLTSQVARLTNETDQRVTTLEKDLP